MESIIKSGAEVAVIAEPGALTFATRKEWQPLPETALDELERLTVVRAFKGTSSIYFILERFEPLEKVVTSRFLLLKVSDDEEGKLSFDTMPLDAVEVQQLKRNRLTLWD